MRAHPEGGQIQKMQEIQKYKRMYFGRNMLFWKVWLKTDSIAVFGAFFYIGWHVAKLIFDIFGKTHFFLSFQVFKH